MSSVHVPGIGDSVRRIDGLAKVTGSQVYPSDFILEDMLVLRVHRSPHPHARILSIDTREAEKVPGVAAVFTARDIPGKKEVGVYIQDMPLLCDQIVKRQGDGIAVVAAESDEAARQAEKLIRVEYELLPVVTSPEMGLLPDAPLVHPNGNLLSELHFGHGDVEAAFATADRVFELDYFTGRQEHAFLETEGGAAYYDENGLLTIRVGGQFPHRDQELVASVLGIDPKDVHVTNPIVGGAFGGKDDFDVAGFLGLVTYLTKRPCRIILDRDESILSGSKRHPFHIYMKTACTADGQWLAAEVKAYTDTGAYASHGEAVLNTALIGVLGPYNIPNVKIDGYCVFTNNALSGAFRGFGAPQAALALEQQVDWMAADLKIDPIEFRRQHALKIGQLAPVDFVVKKGFAFKQALEAAEFGPLWSQKDKLIKTDLPWKKRGIGIAACWMGVGYGAGIPDDTEAYVKLVEEGHYQLLIGGTEMGQGNATAIGQITAHELNCSMEQIEVIVGDSFGPNSGDCNAARQITIVGMAAVKAARHLLEQISAEICREIDAEPKDLKFEGLEVVIPTTGERRSLAGLGEFTGKGLVTMPEVEYSVPGIPAHYYTVGAQVALVEVDTYTGKVEVLKLHSVIDAGKVINRTGIEGQSEGGLAQGLGYALMEDCEVADGKMVNNKFSTYIIPSIGDVPYEMVTTTLEEPEPLGPYGAKGIAEVVLVPTAAAILNAVYDATGERFGKIPLKAEDVLMRLSHGA